MQILSTPFHLSHLRKNPFLQNFIEHYDAVHSYGTNTYLVWLILLQTLAHETEYQNDLEEGYRLQNITALQHDQEAFDPPW